MESEFELRPEHLNDDVNDSDYSEFLLHAIKVGASIQNYPANGKVVRKIFLPNPKSYDLSNLPPHVFFDGTMLEEKFLTPKLKGVKFERLEINYKPLWKLRVWQNCNTDIPKNSINKSKNLVMRFISDVIVERGMNHKYFFLTSKDTRKKYLSKFIEEQFPGMRYVLCHYRNMKGINDAKDCDIGFMIGSYILSSSVEYAHALELLKEDIPRSTHHRR